MTKEQKADALLYAAKCWQNGRGRYEIDPSPSDIVCDSIMDYGDGWEVFDDAASAALSEVAGMGFDIVNADGSECEKVAKVFRASLTKAPTGHRYGYVVEVHK